MTHMLLSTPNISQPPYEDENIAAFEKNLLFSAQSAIIGIYRKRKEESVHAETATMPPDLWRTTS